MAPTGPSEITIGLTLERQARRTQTCLPAAVIPAALKHSAPTVEKPVRVPCSTI